MASNDWWLIENKECKNRKSESNMTWTKEETNERTNESKEEME